MVEKCSKGCRQGRERERRERGKRSEPAWDMENEGSVVAGTDEDVVDERRQPLHPECTPTLSVPFKLNALPCCVCRHTCMLCASTHFHARGQQNTLSRKSTSSVLQHRPRFTFVLLVCSHGTSTCPQQPPRFPPPSTHASAPPAPPTRARVGMCELSVV